MTSEDQLAFILSHEVEHIDHYHCAERVQVQARLKNLQLEVVGALVQIPLQVWESGYTKDEELEADREGLRLAVLSGYSPYGAVTLFEKCAKLHEEYVIHAHSPEQEISELAMQSLEGYFRSHPMPSERLAQANQLIAQNALARPHGAETLSRRIRSAQRRIREMILASPVRHCGGPTWKSGASASRRRGRGYDARALALRSSSHMSSRRLICETNF
jgi:predicted Zn-dependent protease